MPTYQYACTNPEGKHEFEVVQSFTDAPVAECPTCTATVRKVYGSVGVVFKGSGFYRTDSRSGGTEKAASEGSSSKESSSKESSPKESSSTGSSPKESSSKDSSPAKTSTPASSGSSTGSSGGGSKAAAG